jgi:hypothetical protein
MNSVSLRLHGCDTQNPGAIMANFPKPLFAFLLCFSISIAFLPAQSPKPVSRVVASPAEKVKGIRRDAGAPKLQGEPCVHFLQGKSEAKQSSE